MSRSLTEPSPAELEVVRRAQREMLYGEWDEVAKAMTKLGIGALSKSRVEDYTVAGEGPPASIAYLHSIVARGLGDSYNYHDREFVVEIHPEDIVREASLKRVRAVVLTYAKGVV